MTDKEERGMRALHRAAALRKISQSLQEAMTAASAVSNGARAYARVGGAMQSCGT